MKELTDHRGEFDGYDELVCSNCGEEDNLIIQDNGEELCERCNNKLIEEKLIEEENENI